MRRVSTRTACIGTPKRIRHLVLNLGRVLGRAVHQHIRAFVRHGQCGLTFQIEMLLPAKFEAALDHMGRAAYGRIRVALGVDARAVFEPAVGGQRLFDRQDRVSSA